MMHEKILTIVSKLIVLNIIEIGSINPLTATLIHGKTLKKIIRFLCFWESRVF